MKRGMDVIFSLVGLILLSPILAAIALSILLTSGRPIIFSQIRVGKNRQQFVLKKFRTMTLRPGTEPDIFEPGGRKRITAVGRLLRMSKLDELAQLWNVLKGDMSIVGPRPEVPKWVAAYPECWRNVLSIRPGITDPASIVYRDEESTLAQSPDSEKTYGELILPRKLMIYQAYLREHTCLGDLRIIGETLGKIVSDNFIRK